MQKRVPRWTAWGIRWRNPKATDALTSLRISIGIIGTADVHSRDFRKGSVAKPAVALPLRKDSRFFKRNEEVIFASANLFVFIFVMTAIVYETQHYRNPLIANYADALYFTVTALTTTGFGDITLQGTAGRMISVVIMVCGVTLFLNLARTLFQPRKVFFQCPDCGLQRHDYDAVHCKACGVVINIPNDEKL